MTGTAEMPPWTLLGRLPAEDSRDYPLEPKATTREDQEALDSGYRYWWQDGWWGDQWFTPQCVTYAWTHFLEDGPVTFEPRKPNRKAQFGQGAAIVNPNNLYHEAQLVDEWAGTDYDGTSVRAGAKVLQRMGLISEYRRARDIDTLVKAILTEGPVVVGTTWTSNMTRPDEENFIFPTGEYQGGHAYLLNGVNLGTGILRLKNSWGRTYGKKGNAYIRIEDFETLLADYGEAYVAYEVAMAA